MKSSHHYYLLKSLAVKPRVPNKLLDRYAVIRVDIEGTLNYVFNLRIRNWYEFVLSLPYFVVQLDFYVAHEGVAIFAQIEQDDP